MAVNPGKTVKHNQLGEIAEEGDLPLEHWEGRWQQGSTRFHMAKVHPMLEKYYHRLISEEVPQRVFIPLCGKTLDIKWLAEKGHHVVGNEYSEVACKQFFEENDIDYTTKRIEGIDGKILQSKDDKINVVLFCCDFYQLSKDIIGEFDCLWDRGSFSAINMSQRKQYMDIILTVLKPTSRYLLDTFMVDHNKFVGPPHQCTREDLETLLGDRCSIEKLEERDAFGEWQRDTWQVDYFYELVFLLRLK